jgi:hypothetical protein
MSPHQLDSTHRSGATTDLAAKAASDKVNGVASLFGLRGGMVRCLFVHHHANVDA